MSWFDGKIPQGCRDCFHIDQGKWLFYDDLCCDDRCDFYLAMFPILTEDGQIDQEKMDIINAAITDPVWHIS